MKLTLYEIYAKYDGFIVRYADTNKYMAYNTNDLGWMNIADPEDETVHTISKVHIVETDTKQLKIAELDEDPDYVDIKDCTYTGLESALNAIKICYN